MTAVLEPTAEYPTLDTPAPPADEPAYTGSGNPRTPSTPGRKPGQKNGTGRTGHRTAAAPPRGPGPGRPPGGAAKKRTDYRPGVKGLLQLVGMVPALVARTAKKRETQEACMADVVAVEMHADNLAGAIDETAQHDARLASALDRLLTIGPYGLIIGAVVQFGAQLAVNHGVAPEGFMGALPRAQLLAQLAGDEPAPAPA